MALENYGFGETIEGFGFYEVKEKIIQALADEGFGIVTEVDVQATLKKKLDIDFRRYVILGAFHPALAYRALGAEPDAGLLLPCNVVVQEQDNGTGVEVSMQSPDAMMETVESPGLEAVASEAEARLRRALAAVDNLAKA